MKRTVLVGSLLLAASRCFAPGALADGAETPCQSTVTGDLRLHALASQIFHNTRTVRVLVPRGYDAPENSHRRYPVLYLLDGQNLFDACLSFLSHHEWQVDETVDRLVSEGKIPPLIVVGIDNGGDNRTNEYLPYKDYFNDPNMPEPSGKKFPDFLTEEVMPLVNDHYRTLRRRANTGLGGSSYGAVAALYTVLAKPRQFGLALIESAPLYVGKGQLVRDTRRMKNGPERIFIGFGGQEGSEPGENAELQRLIRQLKSNLMASGYRDDQIRIEIKPNARHTEEAWAERLPDALLFLYGKPS